MSALPRQRQEQDVQLGITVSVDKPPALNALLDTTVPIITRNQSYVLLENTVLQELLLALTVMLGFSVLLEVLRKTPLQPSVHWDTIAQQGQQLKHLVIWEPMVQQRDLQQQQTVRTALKDFIVLQEQLVFQPTVFCVQEDIIAQLKLVITRPLHVHMASSTIILEQLLQLNVLIVLQEGTARQVLMIPCMMVIFAPEDLIAPKAREQLQ